MLLKVLESFLVDRCPHRSEIQSIALAETESQDFFSSLTLFPLFCSTHCSKLCAKHNNFSLHSKQALYTYLECLIAIMLNINSENIEYCLENMKPTIYNMRGL